MKLTKKIAMLAMTLCLLMGSVMTVAAADSPTSGTLNVENVTKKISVKKAKKGYKAKITATISDGSKNIVFTKKSGCKYVKVSKTGKIALSKKCKNKKLHGGKHSIKVLVSGVDKAGHPVTKTIKVTIKVK